MFRVAAVALLLGLSGSAVAQQARELTFFSNPGYSGARFTVTGPRTILDLPFTPRSAMLRGGGSWQLCGGRDYRAPCQTIAANQRDLRLSFPRVASIRPAVAPPISPWREISRITVRDRATTDTIRINDRQPYLELKICGERSIVRVRRAEVQLDGRHWQRLFVAPALAPGACTRAIDLTGEGRRITALRFDYEAWSPGWRGGMLVVSALPHVRPQPR